MRNSTKFGVAGTMAAMATLAAVMFLSSGTALPPATTAVIGPQAPIGSTWFDTTQTTRGKLHGAQCATMDIASNEWVLHNYYDLPLTMYVAYQRTGDSEFLAYARRCADEWWKHPQWIGSGSIKLWPNSASPPPRHAGIGGLIVRALDGRPELWDWIVGYTQFSLDLWVKRRVNDPQLYYGLREGGFSLQYAVWVAKTLPDSHPNAAAIRAQLTTDIDNVTVNYFGRLQQPDGSWRWDDPDFRDPDGGTLKGIMQPFMVGLLLNALTDVHAVTASPTVKASVVSQITKACRHLYEGGAYRRTQPVPADTTKRWRSFWYFYHGGTTVNPTKYAVGGGSETGQELWHVKSERQSIGLIVPAYYWAFVATGDPWYRDTGDELWDAAYGGSDGIRNEADGTAKNYNQNYRDAASAIVWRGGVAQPSPTVTPTVTTTPTPLVSPSLSPTGTPTPSPSPTTTRTPSPSPTPPAPTPSPTPAPCLDTSWPGSLQGRNAKMREQRALGCFPVNQTDINRMEYARP